MVLSVTIITLVNEEHPFKDKYLFYMWREDFTACESPSLYQKNEAEESLMETLTYLLHLAPDATLRMILRKA